MHFEVKLEKTLQDRLWSYDLFDILVDGIEVGNIVFRRASSHLVRICGHIGYHIDPPYQGHRYAYRALQAIMGHIQQLGYTSILVTCDPQNLPSKKTIEHFHILNYEEVAVADPEYPNQDRMAIYEIEVKP